MFVHSAVEMDRHCVHVHRLAVKHSILLGGLSISLAEEELEQGELEGMRNFANKRNGGGLSSGKKRKDIRQLSSVNVENVRF